MKPWSLTPRGTFERLADPGNFQPFVVITKEGLHARVPTPNRIHLPPDPEMDWMLVYTNPYGKMIQFKEVERIEFDASIAPKKPIGFARRIKLLHRVESVLAFLWGLTIGLAIATYLVAHAPK